MVWWCALSLVEAAVMSESSLLHSQMYLIVAVHHRFDDV